MSCNAGLSVFSIEKLGYIDYSITVNLVQKITILQ